MIPEVSLQSTTTHVPATVIGVCENPLRQSGLIVLLWKLQLSKSWLCSRDEAFWIWKGSVS